MKASSTNYLGGYFLVKLREVPPGITPLPILYTASDCFNDSLINPWAVADRIDKQTREAKKTFKLTDEDISNIRVWSLQRLEDKKFGWPNVFATVDDAVEYRDTFFGEVENVVLLPLYFDPKMSEKLLSEFASSGEIGLVSNLFRRQAETESTSEQTIGYDLIGIEWGGDFHTFHCNDLAAELTQRFGLRLNSFGLFEPSGNWHEVLDYLNDEETGCEPVPWYLTKVKLVSF